MTELKKALAGAAFALGLGAITTLVLKKTRLV